MDHAGLFTPKLGGFCWMLNGKMLCGVEVGRHMFRVGKDLEVEALARPGATPMDITGRPMQGSVWRADKAEGKALEPWIEFATQYVGAAPRRRTKASKSSRRRCRRWVGRATVDERDPVKSSLFDLARTLFAGLPCGDNTMRAHVVLSFTACG
jgi:hypothetical protein